MRGLRAEIVEGGAERPQCGLAPLGDGQREIGGRSSVDGETGQIAAERRPRRYASAIEPTYRVHVAPKQVEARKGVARHPDHAVPGVSERDAA